MKTRALAIVALSSLLLSTAGRPAARSLAGQDDSAINAVLARLEQAVRAGEPAAYLALMSSAADQKRAADFAASEFVAGATQVIFREQSRVPAADAQPGSGYRVIVDVFVEFTGRARIATWHLDIRKTGEAWAIANQARLSVVNNVFRLAVNPSKQFTARDFTVRAEDLELTLADGSVFVVETTRGPTALLLLGRGTMRFHPTPRVEQDQVRIFSGSDTLETPFEAAFVRFGNIAGHADLATLTPRAVDARDLRRAEEIFREESIKTFAIDINGLAPGNWSMPPARNELVAEVRTRRFGTLTY